MKKTTITVWDYGTFFHKKEKPVKYIVDAWCVQGETGFIAYWIDGDMVYHAQGDDGHWWLVSKMNKHWLPELQKVVANIKEK